MITQKELKLLLEYCPKSGEFICIKERPPLRVGDIPGSISHGYVTMMVNRKTYKAHRLAWLYMTGKWPKSQIDHIDGNRANNRFSNIRECTHSENMRNTHLQSNNKSGVKGVSWVERLKKWRAECGVDGKRFYLGLYSKIEDADLALREFREKYHKEFTNHG